MTRLRRLRRALGRGLIVTGGFFGTFTHEYVPLTRPPGPPPWHPERPGRPRPTREERELWARLD